MYYGLSQTDVQEIQIALDRIGRLNSEGLQSAIHQLLTMSDFADEQAIEVYLARTPTGGIPAAQGLLPGYGTCTLYKVFDDAPLSLEITKVIHNPSYSAINGNTLIPVIRDKFGAWFSTCCSAQLETWRIYLYWPGEGAIDPHACDLDIGVSWLGHTAGWHCGNDSPYLLWTGDSTQCGESVEHVTLDIEGARAANLWSGSTTVEIYGDWWTSRPNSELQTNFTARIEATWRGITRSLIVVPGDAADCAETLLAIAVLNDNGTWTLEAPPP